MDLFKSCDCYVSNASNLHSIMDDYQGEKMLEWNLYVDDSPGLFFD